MAIIPRGSSSLDLTISIPGFSSSYSSAAAGDQQQHHQYHPGGGCGVMKELDINQVPSSGESLEDEDEDHDHDQDQDRDRSINGADGFGLAGGPRKKLRLSKEQSRLLEESFRHNHTLNPKQKEALAMQLKLKPRQVEVWFQNRRARSKLKQTEMECEYLKRWFGSLTEQNRRLQREVEELRAMKVGPPTVIGPHSCEPLPASTLSMCPSCERVTSTTTITTKTTTSSSPPRPSPSPSSTPLSPKLGVQSR